MTGLRDAIAVDYMWRDGAVYWSDLTGGRIYEARVNSTAAAAAASRGVVVVVGGLEAPDGLACDWVARKLYWADSETDRIEVANVDGTCRRVLYWRDIHQPRAIVLDPPRG